MTFFIFSSCSAQICQARAWILSTGFTLAFGAMFSKVWRVHRFTTKAKTDPKVSWHGFCSALGFRVRVTSARKHNLLILLSSHSLHISSLLFVLPSAEKSGALEIVHDGVGLISSRFGDTFNMAASRSTWKTTRDVSTRGSAFSQRRRQDPARAGALRERQQLRVARWDKMQLLAARASFIIDKVCAGHCGRQSLSP